MPVIGARHRFGRAGADRPMIEVNGLSKVFSHDRRFGQWLRGEPAASTRAVADVGFDIADGEVFGLVGPNGAGKTTLLRLLSTLLIPSAGSARVAGLDLVADAAAVRSRIGLVASNERSFFWRLTGRQNLRFFADLYHLDSRAASLWTDELLDLLDLRELADQRFESYSTGNKQRFAIARGLLHRPQLLFMDEPTKGVDPKASADIITLIRERVVSHAGQTVIITSHNLREIEQLCQRTLIMDRGRVAYLGTTGDLKRLVDRHEAYRIELAQRPPPALLGLLSALCLRPATEPQPGVLALQFDAAGPGLERAIRLIIDSDCGLRACSRVEMPIEEAFVAFLARRSAEAGAADQPPPPREAAC